MNLVDEDVNFIEPELLFTQTGLGQEPPPAPASVPLDPKHAGDVPRITRLPDGIEVTEQRAGRAVASWVLQVRCECGRRWFELEPVDATRCPRCGMFVYIDVKAALTAPG
jgi:hypothetical protein